MSSSGSLGRLDLTDVDLSGSLGCPGLTNVDLASRSSLGIPIPDLTDLDLLDLSSRSSLGIHGFYQELTPRRHHVDLRMNA